VWSGERRDPYIGLEDKRGAAWYWKRWAGEN